jgi:hypothetical protein
MEDQVQPDAPVVKDEVEHDFLNHAQRAVVERKRFEKTVLHRVRLKDAILDGAYVLSGGLAVGDTEIDLLVLDESGGVVIKLRGQDDRFYSTPSSNILEVVWRVPQRKAKVLRKKSDRPVARNPKRQRGKKK